MTLFTVIVVLGKGYIFHDMILHSLITLT